MQLNKFHRSRFRGYTSVMLVSSEFPKPDIPPFGIVGSFQNFLDLNLTGVLI